MEHLINFRDGIITYENLFWLFKNSPNETIDQLQFEEDLLQVSFFDEKYILDVGWYPNPRKNGVFKVYVIKNYDWENPLFIRSHKNINHLFLLSNKGLTVYIRNTSIGEPSLGHTQPSHPSLHNKKVV